MLELQMILALATEALKTFNNIYEDQPVQQRRANALIWWSMWKPLVEKILAAQGIQMPKELQ